MNSDKICGIITIVFSVFYGFTAYQLPRGVTLETLGPRAFPISVAIVFAIVGIFLLCLKKQSVATKFPRLLGWVNIVKVLIITSMYAFFIDKLGFLLSTAFFASFLSYVFGSRLYTSLFTGIGISLTLYILFDILLEIPLPWGHWISLFIEER